MGPWGALIMGFFGGVFCVVALILARGWPNLWLAVPVIIYACIAAAAWRRINHATPDAYNPDARTARIISRATIFEGIAIPVMALGLANTGHQNLVLPGVALVVGLHFLPMAYVIPHPRFYAVAACLIVAAAAGFALPQPSGSILAGLVAALTLWVVSALALQAQPRPA